MLPSSPTFSRSVSAISPSLSATLAPTTASISTALTAPSATPPRFLTPPASWPLLPSPDPPAAPVRPGPLFLTGLNFTLATSFFLTSFPLPQFPRLYPSPCLPAPLLLPTPFQAPLPFPQFLFALVYLPSPIRAVVGFVPANFSPPPSLLPLPTSRPYGFPCSLKACPRLAILPASFRLFLSLPPSLVPTPPRSLIPCCLCFSPTLITLLTNLVFSPLPCPCLIPLLLTSCTRSVPPLPPTRLHCLPAFFLPRFLLTFYSTTAPPLLPSCFHTNSSLRICSFSLSLTLYPLLTSPRRPFVPTPCPPAALPPASVHLPSALTASGNLLGTHAAPTAFRNDPGLPLISLDDKVERWTCALCDFICGPALHIAITHIQSDCHSTRVKALTHRPAAKVTYGPWRALTFLQKPEVIAFLNG
ncbi:unnamed protein product [Closterium sp. Naga37s-1]|nr:unnamed protein product [Closterium sp. Naga37s-1]